MCHQSVLFSKSFSLHFKPKVNLHKKYHFTVDCDIREIASTNMDKTEMQLKPLNLEPGFYDHINCMIKAINEFITNETFKV